MFTLATDIWCDHCHHRYTNQLSTSGLDLTLACPNCSKLSLLVYCATCQQRHGIADLGPEQDNWICPTCKAERLIGEHARTRFQIEPLLIAHEEIPQRQSTSTARGIGGVLAAAILIYMILYALQTANPFILEPEIIICLLYTSPSPRDGLLSRMPSSA